MAQKFYNDPGQFGVGYPIIGLDSIVFHVADALYINTDGLLTTATTSSKIVGFSLEDVTMSSTNSTVAKVCPKYAAAQSVEVRYPANGAFAQTNVGAIAVFSSATAGAQTISTTTSDTVGQFMVLGFDPDNDGTTTDVVVRVALPQDKVSSAT